MSKAAGVACVVERRFDRGGVENSGLANRIREAMIVEKSGLM
jgi:hypothetical protein